MEWIERQIERLLERVVERLCVGYHRWTFDVVFDRRERLRVFRRLIVYQLIYLILLVWINSQNYSIVRTLAIVLLEFEMVSTTLIEYLAMIRVGWGEPELDLALVGPMVNNVVFGFAVCACGDYSRDENYLNFLRFTFHYFNYENFRWFIGLHYAGKPCNFQIRKSIPGQQNPQLLHLIVWLHHDICEVFNAQLAANLPPILDLLVPDFAWPTMDEAPRWILMKLSENAAMAG